MSLTSAGVRNYLSTASHFRRERANLAITLAGKDDQVLAFGAFFDYPTSASCVDAANWEEWLQSNFQCQQANVGSTYACIRLPLL